MEKAIRILEKAKYQIDFRKPSECVKNNFRRDCNATLSKAIESLRKEQNVKKNEWVLMISMLSVAIFSFAVGLFWMGMFWMTFLIWFGIVEWRLSVSTGKTLSQHVWTKKLWVRIVLSVLMVISFGALGFHFIWG